MLVAASVVFLYYSVWTLIMVSEAELAPARASLDPSFASLVPRMQQQQQAPSAKVMKTTIHSPLSTRTTLFRTCSPRASGPSAYPSSSSSWAPPSSARSSALS